MVVEIVRKPNQQPRTARKYRKRPGGDASPEITNGLGAFLYAVRSRRGFDLTLWSGAVYAEAR
jgi:hypothetical protein